MLVKLTRFGTATSLSPNTRWSVLGSSTGRPQNFFKHSNDDPEGVLEFAPVSLEYVLFECAVLYHLYTGRPLREAWIFTVWFSVEHPNLVKPGVFNDAIEQLNREAPGAARRNKQFFLELMNRADIGLNAD